LLMQVFGSGNGGRMGPSENHGSLVFWRLSARAERTVGQRARYGHAQLPRPRKEGGASAVVSTSSLSPEGSVPGGRSPTHPKGPAKQVAPPLSAGRKTGWLSARTFPENVVLGGRCPSAFAQSPSPPGMSAGGASARISGRRCGSSPPSNDALGRSSAPTPPRRRPSIPRDTSASEGRRFRSTVLREMSETERPRLIRQTRANGL
jgi:hypothetical protein